MLLILILLVLFCVICVGWLYCLSTRRNDESRLVAPPLDQAPQKEFSAVASDDQETSTFLYEYNHELRNPLTLIIAKAEDIQSDPLASADSIRYAEGIIHQAQRIAMLIDASYTVSFLEPATSELLHIEPILENSLSACRNDRIRVEKHYQPVAPLRGNPSRLEMILSNIIQNACEGMPDGGILMLTLHPSRHDNATWIHLDIADTGTGMDEATLAKAFVPFFSTKSSDGHGFGLTIVKRLVDAFKGTIRIESTLGQGTVVHLTFPAA